MCYHNAKEDISNELEAIVAACQSGRVIRTFLNNLDSIAIQVNSEKEHSRVENIQDSAHSDGFDWI